MINGFFGVMLKTDNVKKLAEFYSSVLKLKTFQCGSKQVVLKLGNDQFLVIFKDKNRIEPLTEVQNHRMGFSFLVDDVDLVYKHLKRHARVPSRPSSDGKRKSVMALDPEGNKIQFIQVLSKRR